MSARDKFHEAVKVALLKDGWTITADPLFFRFGGVDVYIDLAAEQIIAAERNGEAIAIEMPMMSLWWIVWCSSKESIFQ
jgi:XisH protein